MNAVYRIKSRLESKALDLRDHAEFYEFGAGMDDTCRAMIRKAKRLESIAVIF